MIDNDELFPQQYHSTGHFSETLTSLFGYIPTYIRNQHEIFNFIWLRLLNSLPLLLDEFLSQDITEAGPATQFLEKVIGSHYQTLIKSFEVFAFHSLTASFIFVKTLQSLILFSSRKLITILQRRKSPRFNVPPWPLFASG